MIWILPNYILPSVLKILSYTLVFKIYCYFLPHLKYVTQEKGAQCSHKTLWSWLGSFNSLSGFSLPSIKKYINKSYPIQFPHTLLFEVRQTTRVTTTTTLPNLKWYLSQNNIKYQQYIIPRIIIIITTTNTKHHRQV